MWVAKRPERSQRLRALLWASMDEGEKAAAVLARARYGVHSSRAYLSVNFALSGWDESISTLCFIISDSDVFEGSTMVEFEMLCRENVGWGTISGKRGGADLRIHSVVRV